MTRLLRHPAPTESRIAQEVTDVLVRNEQAGIYHWYARTGQVPPGLKGSLVPRVLHRLLLVLPGLPVLPGLKVSLVPPELPARLLDLPDLPDRLDPRDRLESQGQPDLLVLPDLPPRVQPGLHLP